MIVTMLVDVGARAARWRWLLRPIKSVRYPRMLGYTYLGYLANNVLPARLGELFRSHAAGEGEGISRTTVLGTVVVERVVDTVIVVGLGALAVVVLSVRGIMSSAVLLGAAFVALLIVGLGLGDGPAPPAGCGPGHRVRRALAEGRRAGEAAARGPRGRGQARDPDRCPGLERRRLVGIDRVVPGRRSGARHRVDASPRPRCVTSGVALAMIVPSGPGNLGTFELTAVAIMASFGVDRDSAFAVALLVHAIQLLVTSVGGVIAALRLRVGLGIGSLDTRDDPDTRLRAGAPTRRPAGASEPTTAAPEGEPSAPATR